MVALKQDAIHVLKKKKADLDHRKNNAPRNSVKDDHGCDDRSILA